MTPRAGRGAGVTRLKVVHLVAETPVEPSENHPNCEEVHTASRLDTVKGFSPPPRRIAVPNAYAASTPLSWIRATNVRLSQDAAAVVLFSLLGLTISAAMIGYFPADQFSWIFAHFG
jgi:hypothetical protein